MAERSAARDPHPRARLDDNFSTPIRFSLIAALGDGVELDFAALAEILQSNDSVLSKAIAHLSAVGYVSVRKAPSGGRARTWVRSTAAGRKAFAAHVRALREIVELGGEKL